MKVKLISAVLMAALFLSGTVTAYSADKGPKSGDMFMKKNFEKMAKELNLSENQKAQIEEHRKANMKEMRDIRKQTTEKNRALKTELDKLNSDKAVINRLMTELKDLHGKQLQSMVDRVMEMKEILTPEQYKKMTESMDKGMKKMQNKIKKHGMGGPDCPPDMDGPGPDKDMPL